MISIKKRIIISKKKGIIISKKKGLLLVKKTVTVKLKFEDVVVVKIPFRIFFEQN